MRLDRFLWFARLTSRRAYAQQLAEGGHLRIDGRRIERAHAPVRVGNVLAFAHRGEVRIVRVEKLPARRGPPAEGRACYIDLKIENVSQKEPFD
ncbi:MAG: S4 domain-containing protein [Sphingomonas sp.]